MTHEKLDPPIQMHIDWHKVGHVHSTGWGTNREDGGPDGVAVEVHFPGEQQHRVVFLDPDDVEAILDTVIDNKPQGVVQ